MKENASKEVVRIYDRARKRVQKIIEEVWSNPFDISNYNDPDDRDRDVVFVIKCESDCKIFQEMVRPLAHNFGLFIIIINDFTQELAIGNCDYAEKLLEMDDESFELYIKMI